MSKFEITLGSDPKFRLHCALERETIDFWVSGTLTILVNGVQVGEPDIPFPLFELLGILKYAPYDRGRRLEPSLFRGSVSQARELIRRNMDEELKPGESGYIDEPARFVITPPVEPYAGNQIFLIGNSDHEGRIIVESEGPLLEAFVDYGLVESDLIALYEFVDQIEEQRQQLIQAGVIGRR